MGNKTLHSITFPGLVDKYISPEIASEFSSSTAYAVGDYVTKEGTLYRFTTAHAAGSWNAGHVSEVKIGKEVSDLKSALDDLEDICLSEFNYSESSNIDISTGNNNKNAITGILIPSGTIVKVIITDTNSIIPSGKLTLYYLDSELTKQSLGTINVNTETTYTLQEACYGFDIYKTNVVTAGTIVFSLNWTIYNENENFDSRITELESDKDSDGILTYSKQFAFSSSDFEIGGIENGTGKSKDDITTRMRSKNFINAYKGLVINSTIDFNVFEYDLITSEYNYDTTGWKRTYTVTQDCKIKLLFNSTNAENVVNAISCKTPIITLSPSVVENNRLKNAILNSVPSYFPSTTMKSIAHRGRYGKGIGMMCGASAVVAAKKYGFSVCENDVALTSDGEMVMWHDSTLSAIGDPDHSIGDYTLAELKEMDFGAPYGFTGEQILTFAEWIMVCKQVGVDCYIDFKATGEDFTNLLAEELVNTIKTLGMLDHVTYLNNQAKIRSYHPNARLIMLVPPTQERIESFQQYLVNGPVVFDPSANSVTSEMCELALLNGYGMECYYVGYSVSDKETVFEEIERLSACGVQNITLDYYRVEDAFNAKYNLH